ncbi:lipid-transfer protein [Gammaproteobacteria bacterium]|nr:lipid-transfer protein [Gammaproteobacteria bacterium]MDA9370623.1 lipid-transfer protein [Gammaproteobacteria bacterium]MDB9896068.1 lipid-transfer protein [Gammaproteobacteria bacterium]MDC1300183.1 lipid-transfer protein [Gammaproteobacteria bacterium]MDC1326450.1 lipid-transfer protein [Gammaproteobacteria bacterium]
MKKVAIVGYAQHKILPNAGALNEVELLMPVVHKVFADLGISQDDIGFTCSGSCDYLQGAAFAFVEGLSAIQTHPPIKESHVEMDAAWALYESILKVKMGDAETALVYGFGKSSPGNLDSIISLQMDPYYISPLWPDRVSLAALQARVLLEQKIITAEEMMAAVVESRKHAASNPNALITDLLSEDLYNSNNYKSSPLRALDCPPISDGASAMIIASEDKAFEYTDHPIWIEGIDHRIESSNLGSRDLATSPTIESSAKLLQLENINFDVAELHTQFSHELPFLQKLLNLGDVPINLSGGPLVGNVMMCAGLDAIGKTYESLVKNQLKHGLAHATSGPCLQHNMLVHLERQS